MDHLSLCIYNLASLTLFLYLSFFPHARSKMKTQTLYALAALVGVTAVGPTNGYRLVQARDVANLDTAPDMTFIGPFHVGGPNVTLTGTFQSIYAQIHEANPDYNPWDFSEYREHMKELGISQESETVSTLAKRARM